MSPAERPSSIAVFTRLLRSEMRLVYRRRRNIALLTVLALAPILIGVTLRVAGPPARPGDGPQFLSRVTGNGLFLVFATLVVTLPIFLPLAVSVVAGDSVAGEASIGTLRSLLTAPVSRGRLLVTKWLADASFAVAAVLTVAVVALLVGAALFPLGRVTLLSGTTVSLGAGLLRSAEVAGYVCVSLLGLTTLGIMFSVFTEVPVAAIALTLGVAIVCSVLDAVPQLHAVHPYLLTHHWLDFGELLRLAPRAGTLWAGVAVQAAWAAVAASIAWARFVTADVTS